MAINYSKLIEIARALKEKNISGRCAHSSFVFSKSKLLSIGFNKYKTHPQTKNYSYHRFAGIHSELDAVLKLGMNDCSGLTIVNIRIDKNENLCNSQPCRGCSELIKTLGFKRIIYTNNIGNFVEE
jgi:deoxycytidylate deaminase